MTSTDTAADRRIARGLWLPRSSDDGLAARAACVAAALPSHCVVVGRSAARLHGLWLPPPRVDEPLEVAHTASGRGRRMSRTTRRELHGSRREFGDDDVVEVDGLRVTSPARTWFDLAARLDLAALVALGDSVLRIGTTPDDLDAMARRLRGRRGVARARAARPLLDARSRSRPESHLRAELSGPGWPRWAVNVAIRDREGGWLAEPDLSDEDHAVAVEYLGDVHARLERMRRDLSRAVSITGQAWQVLSVGPAEVFSHPDRMRLAVRTMLVRAGWRPR